MLRTRLLRAASAGLLSIAALSQQAYAWDDGAAKPERLLPLTDRIPDGLDAEDLDVLGPSWATWSQETADIISDLYENALDDQSQSDALSKLQARRETIKSALSDPAYGPIHPYLLDLRGKLERRIEVYNALRTALSGPVGDQPQANPFGEYQAALNEVDSSLLVMPQGQAWIPYINSPDLNQIVDRGHLIADDVPLLTKAQQRLADVSSLTPEQQQFLQQPMFRRLAAAIDASLASLQQPEQKMERGPIFGAAETFLKALEDYEASGSRDAAARMRDSLHQIESLAGGNAAALRTAMGEHYWNYNLHLAVGETFMQTFFSDQRSESGGVSEYVQDVYVSGCQWTNTRVNVDLKPCDTAAKFTLTIDGDNRSRTTGEVCSATVYNSGTARFRAEKDIVFDGLKFSLCPSRIGVNASNCTYDAETCLSWVPIAGNLARNFALEKAAERKPESDAYTRQKISREVRSRFDRETSKQFSEAEQKIQTDLYRPLDEINLRPEAMALSSSETHLSVRERLMEEGELGAGRPPEYPIPLNGLLVQLHQSLLSNGSDRMEFAGQRLTQKEVDEKIKSKLDRIMKDRPVPEAKTPPADETEVERQKRLDKEARDAKTKLVFDTIDPISFQFEDGAIIMSLRAGLEREGEESIPTQIISVPLKLSVEGDKVVMTRGNVGVKPAERPRNLGEQIARARIMIQKIEEGIPERREQDASKEIKQQGKSVTVQVRSIISEDGWLTLNIE
ncbi:MAG: hypothetical protein ACK5Q5_10630 [Planctomycetaceae bacterium]